MGSMSKAFVTPQSCLLSWTQAQQDSPWGDECIPNLCALQAGLLIPPVTQSDVLGRNHELYMEKKTS